MVFPFFVSFLYYSEGDTGNLSQGTPTMKILQKRLTVISSLVSKKPLQRSYCILHCHPSSFLPRHVEDRGEVHGENPRVCYDWALAVIAIMQNMKHWQEQSSCKYIRLPLISYGRKMSGKGVHVRGWEVADDGPVWSTEDLHQIKLAYFSLDKHQSSLSVPKMDEEWWPPMSLAPSLSFVPWWGYPPGPVPAPTAVSRHLEQPEKRGNNRWSC